MASLDLIQININNNNSSKKKKMSNHKSLSGMGISTAQQQQLSSQSSHEKFQVVAGSTPFVKATEGKVYKEATKRERDFYEMLQKRDKAPLLDLIPKYYGTYTKQQKEYIILQDLTYGYSKPCIMDIKLGLSHHDVDLNTLFSTTGIERMDRKSALEAFKVSMSTQQKNEWLISKYITTPLLGFCLCGFQKYNVIKKEFEKTNKEQGRYLNLSTIETKLYDFFSNGQGLRSDSIKGLIQKLKSFKDYFENNPEFRFRSSSLLFIYEGDINSINKCELKLIDFTHAIPYPKHIQAYSSDLSNYIPRQNQQQQQQQQHNHQEQQSTTQNHHHHHNHHHNNHNDVDQQVAIEEVDSDHDHDHLYDSIDQYNCTTFCKDFFPVDGGYLFGVTNLVNIFNTLLIKYNL